MSLKELLKRMALGALSMGLFCSQPGDNYRFTMKDGGLPVNVSGQHYASRLSRKSGEKELFNNAKTSKVEEAWAYVRYTDGSEIWYEHGDNEDDKSVGLDWSLLDMLADKADSIGTISFYHIHSKQDYEVFTQTPADNDIFTDLHLLEDINKLEHSLTGKIDCKVVTLTGIYTFAYSASVLSDEAAVKNVKAAASTMEGERFRIMRGASRQFEYAGQGRDALAGMNKKFAEKFSIPEMKITFEADPD